MYGIFTCIYKIIHLVDFYGFHVGQYASRPMDPMGNSYPQQKKKRDAAA